MSTRLPTAHAASTDAASDPDELDALVRHDRNLYEAAVDRTRALREEHRMVLHSPARRRIAGALRSAVLALRTMVHPLDAAAGLGVRAAAWRPLARLRAGIGRFAVRTSPLRAISPVTAASEVETPRWLGPVVIAGQTRDALFCHAPAEVGWHVQPARRGRFVVDCALSPAVWRSHPADVTFTVEVRSVDAGTVASRTCTVRPGTRWADHRWRRLAIAMPDGDTIAITVRTHPARGSGNAWAWALLGDPRLEWPRPRRELLRSLWRALRVLGWRGAASRALRYQPLETEQSRYLTWCDANAPGREALAALRAKAATLARQPLISVITPVWNTDPRLLTACYESIRAQVYPRWEWCIADDASTREETRAVLAEIACDPRVRITRLTANGHICRASNEALALASGEYVAFLDHDDELAPDALAEMALAIDAHPEVDFLYSDEDKLDLAGQRCDPFFKPDWSPEFFRTCMYTCHLMVLRRTLVEQIGGFRPGFEGAQDYDLALRAIERTTAIRHVAKILYHWRKLPESTASSAGAKPWALAAGRRAVEDHASRLPYRATVRDGAVPGLHRVQYAIAGRPRVTILIPTDGRIRDVGGRRLDLVANAVRSIVERTTYSAYDLLVADNGRLSAEAERLLAGVPHTRLHYTVDGAFNFAHKLNFCAAHADCEHVVVFNDDLEVVSPEWLEAMLEFSQQADVGVVGAKLFYPDGRLQHAGMVLGVCGVAAHAWHGFPGDTPGYASSAIGVRNYSAVTGACLMTRREVFRTVGGFNEDLAIDFNDVDYCLRVREQGLRIVFTPYATLVHHESGTLGPRTQDVGERRYMMERWGHVLARDPYYNENLTREFPDFRLRT
jgi:GT2 family glycosyltransferase